MLRSMATAMAFLIFSLTSFVSGGQTQELTNHDLRSASELDYPPFAVIQQDGSVGGFSVELLKEVAAVSGLKVSFEVGQWHKIKQRLIDGQLDVLPLVSYSQEREKVLDFTVPYLHMHGTIFVRKGETSIKTESDLRNKEVLVMRGDTAHEYAVENKLTEKLILTNTFVQAMQMLSKGRHDAIVIQQLVGHQLLKRLNISNLIDISTLKQETLQPVGRPLSGFEQKFCMAVPEGSKDLLQNLNEGLSIVMANGSYQRLYDKWFGPILPKASPSIWLIVKYFTAFLIPFGIVVGLIGILYLKKQVARKTAYLHKEVEERKIIETSLRKRDFIFSQMFEQSSTSTCFYDPQGTIIRVNEQFCKMFGVKEQDILNSGYNMFQDQALIEEGIIPNIRELFENKKTRRWEINFDIDKASVANAVPTKKNKKIYLEVFGYPVVNNQKDLEFVVLKHYEITERKKAEQENIINRIRIEIIHQISTMKNASEKDICDYILEKMLSLSNSQIGFLGMLTTDEQIMKIYAWSEDAMTSCSIHDKPMEFPISKAGIWGEAVRNRKPFIINSYNAFHPEKKGYPEGHIKISRYMAVPIFENERIVAMAAVANKTMSYTDIDTNQLVILMNSWWEQIQRKRFETEKKTLRDQIQQAQKLESIGNLAGGIAHDFNNILFPIIGMSELLIEDLPKDSPELENAQEIFTAGNRGAELVKQILTFSRQSDHQLTPVRIQQVLKEVSKLIRTTIPANIEMTWDIQQDCGLVMADSTQLHQIAMNLITNAYHAVEKNNGKINIILKEKALEISTVEKTSLATGNYATLTISDTGHGIAPGILDKIFEPYFTTKELGKGTGLGLAVVHGIIKEYGGAIEVISDPVEGTTFEVYIPIMKKKTDRVEIKETIAIPSGTERILVVDDEVSIAKLEGQMLERLGYKVTTYTSSLEALSFFETSPNKFDLVITDMAMPNFTGEALAEKIFSIRQDIPIIICTGFSENINKEKVKTFCVKGFLMKPVVKSDMAHMVRNVLDDAKG